MAVIRLWSILENAVDELVADFLSRPDDCKDKDLIYNLKGPLLDFIKASPERQSEFLTERLKESINAGLKVGVGRFEAMLEPIGLGGGIDSDIRRVLFEISQVRNALVHKSGFADQRFVQACPWLSVKEGEVIKLDTIDFLIYKLAAYFYLIEIKIRLLKLIPSKNLQSIEDTQKDVIDVVKQLWSNRKTCKKCFKERRENENN